MHGANQMGLGPDFGNGFGGFGSPEGMAENAVATGAMTEAEAYGSFDAPGNVDGGGLSTAQTNAVPTINVVPDQPISPQITSFTNALKAFMGFSPMQNAMKMGMSMMPQDMRAPMHDVMSLPGYQGLVDNNYGKDPNLAQAYGATTGVPYGHDEAMQNVPVVGSGANLGLATSIENIGGQNVHMGPGFTMNENNYPGYGVNDVTGKGFPDPSDPYIRKRRGTEIAGMI